MQSDIEVAVVGGGIAGLASAYRLQEHGYNVRIFEANRNLGGLAGVYETAGDPIEKFYHHLSKSEETIVELAEELGLGEDIEWRIGKNAYYIDGVVHPMDKPWEILSFPHWSLYDKFRLTMLTLDIDVRGVVPKFDTYEQLSNFENIPVEEFARDHTTDTVYETFFEPLLDAKFGSRKKDVSAAWLLGRIKFRGERDFLKGEILGYVDGGFGRLLDALINTVGSENIETGTRVTNIQTTNAEVTGITVEQEDTSTKPVANNYNVDNVVVAAMPNVLENLTGYPCEIDFQGTVCSVISMDESLLDTYWLNIAADAPFGALIEHTNFVEKKRYGGQHLLYVARYIQSPKEDIWQQDDDEVRETWLSGLESLFPGFDRTSVNWVQTARNPRTAPIYERGYLDMVIPYDLSDDVADGLYYAGMASEAQYPERSLNGGIVSGYECADCIVK